MKPEVVSKTVQSVTDDIIAATRDAERVDIREVARRLGHAFDVTFRLAWSHANATMHKNGGGFAPSRKSPGVYVRATTKQKIGRAGRSKRAAIKKLVRQHASIAAADPNELDEAERPSFNRMVERNGALTSRAIAMLSYRGKEVPEIEGVNLPKLPRGR